MNCLRVLQRSVPCLVILLAGCASDEMPSGANGVGNADLHVVMSEQLKVDAARLNVLLFDLHQTETVLARERDAQYRRIAATARSLQQGANQVRASVAALALTDEAQARFEVLAGQLEVQADSLAAGAAAGALTPAEMEVKMAGINATCDSCHALHRNS